MSGIATGTAIAIGSVAAAGIGAGGSILAGSKQAGAAESAAQLQADEAQNALNFQEQEWNTQQANEAPWLSAGKTALGELQGLPDFTAPTLAQAEQNPGYQFQLAEGQKAIQRSAAAQGGLLSGGTAKALSNYSQGAAQSDYQQVYNNMLTQYQQKYNKLAGLSGLGSSTANQLGTQGQSAANNITNTFLTTGQQQGQDIQNAGAATASGYVGASNALSGLGTNLSQYAILQQLLNGSTSNPTGPADFSGFTYAG